MDAGDGKNGGSGGKMRKKKTDGYLIRQQMM